VPGGVWHRHRAVPRELGLPGPGLARCLVIDQA